MSEDIKQKDLFPPELSYAKIKKIRDRFLTDEDWYRRNHREIWIRPSGQLKLRIAEEEPRLARKYVTLRGIRPCPNPRKIWCDPLDGSKRVACIIPGRFGAKPFAGKKFRAEVITGPQGDLIYRHERCTPKD